MQAAAHVEKAGALESKVEAAAVARRAAAEATEALARSAGPYRLTSDVQEEKMAEMDKEVARKEKKVHKWGGRLEDAEKRSAKLLAQQACVEAEGKDLAGRLAASRREVRRLANKERALEVELGEKRDQVLLLQEQSGVLQALQARIYSISDMAAVLLGATMLVLTIATTGNCTIGRSLSLSFLGHFRGPRTRRSSSRTGCCARRTRTPCSSAWPRPRPTARKRTPSTRRSWPRPRTRPARTGSTAGTCAARHCFMPPAKYGDASVQGSFY